MASKMVGISLARGQAVRLETPGGGGYGDPASRAPEEVADDVRLGFVSVEAAKRDYLVVCDPDGTLKLSETETLRAGQAA